MMRQSIFASFLLLMSGCIAEPFTLAEDHSAACSNPKVVYLAHLEEQAGGSCGAVPDQLITTDIATDCRQVLRQGCYSQFTGCLLTMSGTTCVGDTYITFAADGSSAAGVEEVVCTNSSSACESAYILTYSQ